MKTRFNNNRAPLKYRMVTDTYVYGKSKVLTKKEWERQYGYSIAYHKLPNVRFEPVSEEEEKDKPHYIVVSNPKVDATLIIDHTEPMLISDIETIYKGDFIAYREDDKWQMQRCNRLRGLDRKEIKIGNKWLPIERFKKVVATKLHLQDNVLDAIEKGYLRNNDKVSVKTDTILQFEDIENSFINVIYTDTKGYVEVEF